LSLPYLKKLSFFSCFSLTLLLYFGVRLYTILRKTAPFYDKEQTNAQTIFLFFGIKNIGEAKVWMFDLTRQLHDGL